MPLINTSVPNLIQGVSQQPDAVRFDGQCEEQENALSSVVDGLKKRPNTRHVARLLGEAIDENSFVHFINRNADEKYVIIAAPLFSSDDTYTGSVLRAFNIITGEQCTINGATNYTINNGSYLATESPLASLKALTVADSTFLLNSEISVGLKQNENGEVAYTDELEKKALIFIKQGDYSKNYGISITPSEELGESQTLTHATATPVLERYIHRTTGTKSSGYNPRGRRHSTSFNSYKEYYRWRLTGINITSAGSNYTGTPSLSFASNADIYSHPSVQLQVGGENRGVTSYSVLNGGDFDGTGTRGSDAPNVSITVGEINGLGSTRVDAYFTSNGNSNASNADTRNITQGLMTGTYGIDNRFTNSFYRKHKDNLIEISPINNQDFQIAGFDGLAGNGLGVVYKEVASISELPTHAPHGFVVKVRGNSELSQDDLYVRFETKTGVTYERNFYAGQTNEYLYSSRIGDGAWVETVAPGVAVGVQASTMPHILKGIAVNTFELTEMNVEDRLVGDDDTNPLPSFVGQPISAISYFKGRLVLLSNDNLILSESGLGNTTDEGEVVYNFGRTTTSSMLDSDPIDSSVASSRVTSLRAAKGFQDNLVLFSERGQFTVKGGDILTPSNISVTPITNFDSDPHVEPLPLGSYMYFPFIRGAFSGLREFSTSDSNDTYNSVDVTEHVPSYVPSNIIDMAGTTTEDIIALLSGDEPNTLYIYKYFWSGSKKLISSWSKFTLGDDIRGIEFIDSTLYLVTVDSEANTHLLSLPLESGITDLDHDGNPADFLTLLDKRVRAKVTSGSSLIEFEQADDTYSSANADQPYTYYNIPEGQSIPTGGASLPEVFVDSNGDTHTLKALNTNGVQVHLSNGNAPSTLYGYVGIPYTMKYKFSTQVFKAQSGNSASPTSASAMQVRNGSVFFDKTHTFDVKVTPDGRSEVTETFSADDRPDAETLGNRKFAEGYYKFPVHSKAKNVDIVIENESPFDSRFSSAEFESFVHPRSRRYG